LSESRPSCTSHSTCSETYRYLDIIPATNQCAYS
jgi:hypothetical protein